jgi:hypothetical protein
MKHRLFAGIMLVATLTNLASCTKPTDTLIVPDMETGSVATGTATLPEMPVVSSEAPVAPSVQSGAMSVTQSGTVSYMTPGGIDKVRFTLTHTAGKIESIVVTPEAEHEFSKNWQAKFSEAASASLVGKDIKSLDLTAIGGASLTTGAFKQFVGTL